METTIPFDLNQAIQSWRENLAQSPAFHDENLDELESHLRDSISTLQTNGLAANEGFLVATMRIGSDAFLKSEFGKVNPQAVWLERALWMLVGIQFWSFVSGVIASSTRSAVSFALVSYDFTAHGRIIPATLFMLANLLGFTASLVFCWWLISRRGSSLGAWFASRLRRHRLWFLTVIVVCVLSLLSVGMNYGMTILQLKFTDRSRFGEIALSHQYSWIAGNVVQATTLVLLTLWIARNRFHPKKA